MKPIRDKGTKSYTFKTINNIKTKQKKIINSLITK